MSSQAEKWEAAHVKRTGFASHGTVRCDTCPVGKSCCDSGFQGCEFFGGYRYRDGVVLCRKGSPVENQGLAEFMGWRRPATED
jgi:hypothetical protein